MLRLRTIIGAALSLFAAPALAHPGHQVQPVAPAGGVEGPTKVDPASRRWLAGDHHVHSWYSVDWKPAADGK